MMKNTSSTGGWVSNAHCQGGDNDKGEGRQQRQRQWSDLDGLKAGGQVNAWDAPDKPFHRSRLKQRREMNQH